MAEIQEYVAVFTRYADNETITKHVMASSQLEAIGKASSDLDDLEWAYCYCETLDWLTDSTAQERDEIPF